MTGGDAPREPAICRLVQRRRRHEPRWPPGTALGDRLSDGRHTTGDNGIGAAGSNSEAVEFADAVILAVPFAAIDRAVSEVADFGGRVLWSCLNALKPDLRAGPGFNFGRRGGRPPRLHGARVAAAIPPFASAIAASSLAYDRDLPPSVFVCGDDAAAKAVIEGLVRDLGADPVDAGSMTDRLVRSRRKPGRGLWTLLAPDADHRLRLSGAEL